MFLMACELRAGQCNRMEAAPNNLQFTPTLPSTLLVTMVPFLQGRMSTDCNGGVANSLVHDGLQRFHDVKVDGIVIVAETGFAPWDGAGKRTEISRGVPGGSRNSSDRVYFVDK